MIVPDYAQVIEIKNKECWINVYWDGDDKVMQGYCFPERYYSTNKSLRLLYRIHVRLK